MGHHYTKAAAGPASCANPLPKKIGRAMGGMGKDSKDGLNMAWTGRTYWMFYKSFPLVYWIHFWGLIWVCFIMAAGLLRRKNNIQNPFLGFTKGVYPFVEPCPNIFEYEPNTPVLVAGCRYFLRRCMLESEWINFPLLISMNDTQSREAPNVTPYDTIWVIAMALQRFFGFTGCRVKKSQETWWELILVLTNVDYMMLHV